MALIRWICLSDLHFGAENSLLSLVDGDTALVDPNEPSPVLEAFIACLRALIKTANNEVPPTLILNGDILEFALAEDNIAAMVFDRFIDLAFQAGRELFDPKIIYLPGNHDHHMWEAAREHMYADYVRRTPQHTDLLPPWHATRLFHDEPKHRIDADLISALVQRRRGPHLEVELSYPNYGLESDQTDRRVIIHHGHFTEQIYRLMSEARTQLFPKQTVGGDVWDWEADNFAWIDFFWSTLGRSGSAGSDVGLIYDMLQDSEALGQLAGRLGAMAGDFGFKALRPIQRRFGQSIVTHLTELVVRRERHQPVLPLTEAGRKGLTEYLDGPVSLQFKNERPDASGCPLTFLFGHTHKPFQELWRGTQLRPTLPVYNSGGWVVDTEHINRLQGAAVLAIDEQCNVASLEMYTQKPAAAQYHVSITGLPGAAPNELEQHLASALDFNRSPWRDFSRVAAEEVALRQRLLPRIIARGRDQI